MERRKFLRTALLGGIAGTLSFKPATLSAKPVDAAAVSFFNQFKKMPLASVGHSTTGHNMKIGTTNIDSLKVQRIKL
jgi:hypothetical protein